MRAILGLLLLAALVAGLGVWFLGRAGEPPEPTPTGGDPRPQRAQPDTPSDAPATLEVLVFAENGTRVDAARLTLTPQAGGAQREALGSTTFEGVAPGAWRVEVRAAGLWPYDATIQVAPGAEQREIVQLFDHLRVTGTVRTRFGTPLGRQPVWFLRPGEEHPADDAAGAKLVRGRADAEGAFAAELPAPGDWRVSVGLPGAPMLVSSSTSLRPGGPVAAEVTVGGVTLLEVRALDLPVRFQRGKGDFEVLVLSRRPRAQPDDTGPDAWRVWHSAAYPHDGPLEIGGLPTTPVFGLGIMSRLQGEFRAGASFELAPDARTIVTLRHPPRDAPPDHELTFEVEVVPLPVFESPAGVRWR
jgi:hypothetical protein